MIQHGWSLWWFYMSTWQDHKVPRYMARHYFHMSLWECFQVRLASALVESKAGCPSQGEWTSSSLLRAWTEQEGTGRKNLLFCLTGEWKHWSSLDCGLKIAPLTSLVPRSLDSDWTTPLVFLGLQLVDSDHGTWDFIYMTCSEQTTPDRQGVS